MAILFFVGVASVLYPFVGNLVSVMTANVVIGSYDEEVKNLDTSEIDELFAKANEYNKSLYGGLKTNVDAKCLNRTDGIMCYVDVPKVNIYLPVYYGTSHEVLEKGCGYLENTSLPVGGKNTHSVISGHTGLPSAEMFTQLDQVKIGDMFYIHILNKILAYKIDKIQDVKPDETDNLRIVSGEDYVTLLTCTPYGINDRRLLVRGTRVPYTPDENSGSTSEITEPPTSDDALFQNVINQIIIIGVIVLIAIIVFIIACIILHKDRKKVEKYQQDKQSNEKQEE
ncbi:class C sortase [Candidatus Pseudoruminococcus sp.]|uniref:class C sortase n=1 Tax=Candidatus Pseudoruminococcus sp. TaxID=3101048 RepID=UPI003999D45A